MTAITDATYQEDIDSIKSRILVAEADCNGWRMTGLQERYLEACSMVEALALQLDERVAERDREARKAPGSR